MSLCIRHPHRSLLAYFGLAGGFLVLCGSLPVAAQSPEPALNPGTAADGKRDPVELCWDAFEPSEWGKITDCLQSALQQQEAALKAALVQAAAQAEQSMDKKSARRTLEKSNAKWVAYRDAECDRQLAFVAGRNHPDIGEFTCRIRKTAQRIADFRFDD